MKPQRFLTILLPMLSVILGGFVLFNIAFLLFATLVNLPMWASGQDFQAALETVGILSGYSVMALAIGWGLKRFLDPLTYKHTLWATLLTMPLMTLLVVIGASMFEQPQWMVFGIGALIIVPALIFVLYRKLPWMYALAILYVAVLGVFIVLTGIEI